MWSIDKHYNNLMRFLCRNWHVLDKFPMNFIIGWNIQKFHGFCTRNTKCSRQNIVSSLHLPQKLPWSQRLSFNIIFFYYFGNLWHRELIKKALVKIIENLTFMLAQHLTAVKDVIFFWPITSWEILNLSNHMTRRAIKNILQSETMVKSWWYESEDPNGLDQRLSFLRSRRCVPIKKHRHARHAGVIFCE